MDDDRHARPLERDLRRTLDGLGRGSRWPRHANRLPSREPLKRDHTPEIEIRRRFDRLAASYDHRWARYVIDTTRETLDRVDLANARVVLDVGCGTGMLLEEIARRAVRSPRLAGVDLSPAMLTHARRRLGASALLIVGDARRLPFGAGTFDLAISASALHYWREPVATLREIGRVLTPGGRLVVTDWCADRWINRVRDRILRLLEAAHFRVHGSADLEAMVLEAGYRHARVERYGVAGGWELMTATATRAA